MCADDVAGAVTRLGPGYVPRLLGALCMLMGIGLAAYGCFSRPEPAQALSVRPVLFVLSGIAVFAALIETAGLAVTAIAVVAIVSQARSGARLFETALLALGLAALVIGIFVFGLGLPLTVGPR